MNGAVAGLKLWTLEGILVVSLVSTPAAARADVVLDWNEIAARTVIAGQSPFAQARLMAITQRHYTKLMEIADDVDDARVYGGIHYLARYDF